MRDLQAGDVFGTYVIEGVLGRGGMGVVYRAREQSGMLGRVVALKVIRGALADDPDVHARFLREARLAASLEHPSVVPVYAADVCDGVPYVAMRLVDGVDLATLIATSGPLEAETAVSLGGQIAGALDAAHAAGLVHRDVKPSNVLVAGDLAFLADFGLAIAAGVTRATVEGSAAGTLAYMAPEVLRGADATSASDQYALACTLAEALTGAPSRSAAPGTLPPAIDAALSRAFDDDPACRYDTARELVDALARVLAAGDAAESLIGRDDDLARVRRALAVPGLVTVRGPGGVGKTTLARAACTIEGDRLVAEVDLVPLRAPESVIEVLASALGARDPGNRPALIAAIGAALAAHDRPLVLLDNFEHLLDAAPEAAAVVAACPAATFLVTSRAPLRVRGERELELAPLDADGALALLLARAEEARPGLAVDAPTRAALAHLVERLDRLPLAIELASARLRLLSIEQLTERLGRSLDLLTASARDVDPRQASLRATITWSVRLLAPGQAALLARLAVWPGGFTLSAAEAVAPASRDTETVDDLAELVEQALVREAGESAGEPRFEQLETIRAYSIELLRADDAERRAALTGRTLHLMALLAGELRGELGEPDAAWRALAAAEAENVRAAIDSHLERGELEEAAGLVAATWRHWHATGEHAPVIRVAEAVVAAGATGSMASLALSAAAHASYVRSDQERLDGFSERALELARASEDPLALVEALRVSAIAASTRDQDYTLAALREAADVAGRAGLRHRQVTCLFNVAVLYEHLAQFDESERALQEAESLGRKAGSVRIVGLALKLRASARLDRGDYEAARRLAEQALEALDPDEGPSRADAEGFRAAAIAFTSDPPGGVRELAEVIRRRQAAGAHVQTEDEIRWLARVASAWEQHALAGRLLAAALAVGDSDDEAPIDIAARESLERDGCSALGDAVWNQLVAARPANEDEGVAAALALADELAIALEGRSR